MGYFEWTGNPFVDTGLAVIIARAKELGNRIDSINDLTEDIFESVFKSKMEGSDEEYSWITQSNRKLNSYTMIFSNNGPLTPNRY